MDLRGHHIKDFGEYLFERDKGRPHELALKNYLKYDISLGELGRFGESFERNTTGLFQSIYEEEIRYITLIVGLDDVCLGPRREPAGRWCGSYKEDECLNEILLDEDLWFIQELEFEKDIPILTREFVNKSREIKIFSFIYIRK